MVIDVLGTTLSLDGPEPLMNELGRLVSDLEVDSIPVRRLVIEPEAGGTLRLVDTNAVVHTGIVPVVAAATAVWWLNTLVASTAPQVLVHAACVGARSAVLLPGASGVGKSTLAAACLADGLAYLSDEYAALDRSNGTVVPYAKPLDLNGPGLVAASTLRPGSVGTPLAPGGIVFPRFEHMASSAVTALEPGWTFLALAAHTTNLTRLGADAVPWLAALAVSCSAWQVTYHDADDALRLVRELAAGPGVPLRPAPLIGPVTDATITVSLGDEVGVFDIATGRVHLLNPSAAAVWSGVAEVGAESSELSELVLDRATGPAFDRPAVEATIAQLVHLGLLPESPRCRGCYRAQP